MSMHKVFVARLALVFWLSSAFAGTGAHPVVHVYNWSDYITEEALAKFQEETGIRVVYDVYDANEILEAKLLAGNSGYDVVFPSARPFAQRHIKSGLYRPLDKFKLPNYQNLDPAIMGTLEDVDPGNTHIVPYMWGTTGIGYNVQQVTAALGASAPTDSWRLLFAPKLVSRLSACGVTLMDDPLEPIAAALFYQGKSPNTKDSKEVEAAAEALLAVRPYIRYFHSSQYINDLANGDICVAHGYSGDVLQARDRADEAGNGVKIAYTIPAEGAVMWVDVMAIPADAPHPEQAHAFINFLLRPEVIAQITNYVSYANANQRATELVDKEIRGNSGIYPPAEVMRRLQPLQELPPKTQRQRVRTWTKVKSGE